MSNPAPPDPLLCFVRPSPSEAVDSRGFRLRLRWIGQRVGSIAALARRADMSTATLRQWLAGPNEPNRVRMMLLADAAEVAADWLASGEGWHFPYRWASDEAREQAASAEAFRARLAGLVRERGEIARLAEAVGTSESNLRRWIRGPSEPARPMLCQLARGARVRLGWLMGGVECGGRDPAMPPAESLYWRATNSEFDRGRAEQVAQLLREEGIGAEEGGGRETPVAPERDPPLERVSQPQPDSSVRDFDRRTRSLLMEAVAATRDSGVAVDGVAEVFDACLAALEQITDEPQMQCSLAGAAAHDLARVFWQLICHRERGLEKASSRGREGAAES
ncbi:MULTISPECIES: helix-turn-helix transcriptional regulator [Thiorhodovibrio]|uniref:helix-turn-helix transcriptional regulator n=1 Tax=Thiorhodovibrio TaxID=61593 RepID=UPI0019123312|nr:MULTISPECIES: helix-turn-helix transcriptional regulator [Thiorhodovibrio]MBK5969045.1 hypothetical protein [Thiorhodovibrio winogradskyi]WPL15073.1 transcriptional repressor DicA [Thiorhodovibrio litoralis]